MHENHRKPPKTARKPLKIDPLGNASSTERYSPNETAETAPTPSQPPGGGAPPVERRLVVISTPGFFHPSSFMACCRCCCGGVDCTEGQEGKCCCGGISGTCCQAGEYCCSGVCQAGPCLTACSITESGLLEASSGWLPKDGSGGVSLPAYLPITFGFKIEKSQNCGGANGQVQQGTLSCSFTLQAETVVSISVSGSVEFQAASFDFGTLSLGGVSAQISGVGNNLGCTFGEVSDSKTVTLPAGSHTFTASVDTDDGLYHDDSTYTFSLSDGANPLP
jgi:hypothetical protein